MFAFRTHRPVAATGERAPLPDGVLTTARAQPGPGVGARAARALAEISVLLARAIRLATSVIVLIVALGIVFFVLGANPTNAIVSHVHDWARSLAGPFDGMFHLHGPKTTLAVNWGIAVVVWLVIGSLLARLMLAPAWSLRRRFRVAARA
jgi:hypothetical protein